MKTIAPHELKAQIDLSEGWIIPPEYDEEFEGLILRERIVQHYKRNHPLERLPPLSTVDLSGLEPMGFLPHRFSEMVGHSKVLYRLLASRRHDQDRASPDERESLELDISWTVTKIVNLSYE